MMLVPKEKRENGYRRENDASTQKKFKSPAESFAGRHIFQRKV